MNEPTPITVLQLIAKLQEFPPSASIAICWDSYSGGYGSCFVTKLPSLGDNSYSHLPGIFCMIGEYP